jgi:hypothetical protein
MRGLLLTLLGGLGGGILGVFVWFAFTFVITAIVTFFYPSWKSSELGSLPSDASCFTVVTLILILPFATLLGASLGVTRAQRLEARWVLQSLPHGIITTFRDDGSLFAETTYHQGVANGPYRDFWPNSRVACEGQYANGLQDGEWRYYNPDGSLQMKILFSAGQEIQG